MTATSIPPTPAWRASMSEAAYKYHLMGAWCGLVFNLLFSVGDYYIMTDYWTQFFWLRLAVSLAILIGIVAQRLGRIKHELMVAIAVVGISVENAYIYSLMDLATFQQHTFSYIALFIGIGMLVLWEKAFTITMVVANIVAALIFFPSQSPLSLDQIMANGGLLTLSVAVFTVFLVANRYNLTKKEIMARLALSESNRQLKMQKEIIEEKSQEITDSITYAKRIQKAILPPDTLLAEVLPNSYVFYQPKDIVSGDFYWAEKMGDKVLFAAADCTGHGVPGAMVSVVCNEALNRAVREFGLTDPGAILTKTRTMVIATFERSEEEVRDGMDIALIALDMTTGVVDFAGANNPLYVIRPLDNEVTEKSTTSNTHYVHEILADKQPIGKYAKEDPYQTKTVQLKSGDMLVISSDGYPDQFGGDRGKKLKTKAFKRILLSVQNEPIATQKIAIQKAFESWRKDYEQIDDVCVIGYKHL